MSVEQLDSDQMILLTPVNSFGPPDMASVEMPVPTGQLVVTSQVPIQAATNISVNITNPLINGTNQGASGHPTHHEWVWFQLERTGWLQFRAGQKTECRSIGLIVHQELRVLPLKDPMIELLRCVDRIWQCPGCGMGSSKVTQDGMVDGALVPLRMHPLQWWRCTLGVQGGWVPPRWMQSGETHQGGGR